MLPDRFFNDEPARDGYERAGRLMGDVIGLGVMLAMAWVVMRGFA